MWAEEKIRLIKETMKRDSLNENETDYSAGFREQWGWTGEQRHEGQAWKKFYSRFYLSRDAEHVKSKSEKI